MHDVHCGEVVHTLVNMLSFVAPKLPGGNLLRGGNLVRAHAILPIEVLATLKTTIDGLGLGHRAGLPPAPFAHRPGFLCRAH